MRESEEVYVLQVTNTDYDYDNVPVYTLPSIANHFETIKWCVHLTV